MKKKQTQDEQTLCANVNPAIKPQAETLARALLSMQAKIEQQIPKYKEAQLAQQVKVGTGETILRQNPLTQEFRATVKDYAQTLKTLQEIVGGNAEPEPARNLDLIKSKIRIVG